MNTATGRVFWLSGVLVWISIFSFQVLYSQSVNPPFESSNLPIINIRTNGQTIIDEPRIIVDMGITDNGLGKRNKASDPFNHYSGKISIEIRGESSLGLFPKKSYRIETQDAAGGNLNVSLLGMPSENDWVLYAPYTDKTFMRDVLAYKMGRDMGRYAPRTRYVEFMLNGNYQGIYVLIEKVKVDKNRVDISALKSIDVSGEQLTGGYLLSVDKQDANDYPGWQALPTPQLPGENPITFRYYDPNGEDMVEVQRDYIRNYLGAFQSALTKVNFDDPESGYRNHLDIPAAVDFMLVNEIGKNVDAYVYSTYFYKEKDKPGQPGKLVMGPLWDFNLAFGNVDYLANAQFAPGWMWNDQYRMFWFRRLMKDAYFAASMKCRWDEVRNSLITDSYVTKSIDSLAVVLQEAQVRNFQQWPILGKYIWPNQFVGVTFQDEINFLKKWTLDRLHWMDVNMPGDCDLITAVNESPESERISLFPNPFANSVTIKINDSSSFDQIIIHDMLGKEVFSVSFSGNEFVWDGISSSGIPLSKGIYIVTIILHDRIAGRKKLMITDL